MWLLDYSEKSQILVRRFHRPDNTASVDAHVHVEALLMATALIQVHKPNSCIGLRQSVPICQALEDFCDTSVLDK